MPKKRKFKKVPGSNARKNRKNHMKAKPVAQLARSSRPGGKA